jgi:hypothetical protein
MKIINPETGFLVYNKIFKYLLAKHSVVVLWQVSPESGSRQIYESHINSYNFESKKIFLELNTFGLLKNSQVIFGYVEDGGLIFKTSIEEVRDASVCLQLPDEIKLLEVPELQQMQKSLGSKITDVWKVKSKFLKPDRPTPDYMRVKSMAQRTNRDQELLNNEFGLSLDEEDKIFASQRESPRARPKEDKWVNIIRNESGEAVLYKLFDLSRGGMGFLCSGETEFLKGAPIQVIGFNNYNLDDPLIGQVMSIRPLDSDMSEFKVGVKFSDGQD